MIFNDSVCGERIHSHKTKSQHTQQAYAASYYYHTNATEGHSLTVPYNRIRYKSCAGHVKMQAVFLHIFAAALESVIVIVSPLICNNVSLTLD